MKNKKKIVAIMPIKLNNERLPGKNTKLLGEKPLLTYALEALIATNLLEDIYVYCSSEEIVDYLPVGVSFLKRPDYLDCSSSNFTQIFETFMGVIDADIYVYAHATAPFLKAETILECISEVALENYDSSFSAIKIQDYFWEDGKPLNFDAANLPRSQDLKPIYRETSGIYVFTKEVFRNLRRRIGEKPYIKEVNFKESIDINNPEDFELAKTLLNVNL